MSDKFPHFTFADKPKKRRKHSSSSSSSESYQSSSSSGSNSSGKNRNTTLTRRFFAFWKGGHMVAIFHHYLSLQEEGISAGTQFYCQWNFFHHCLIMKSRNHESQTIAMKSCLPLRIIQISAKHWNRLLSRALIFQQGNNSMCIKWVIGLTVN